MSRWPRRATSRAAWTNSTGPGEITLEAPVDPGAHAFSLQRRRARDQGGSGPRTRHLGAPRRTRQLRGPPGRLRRRRGRRLLPRRRRRRTLRRRPGPRRREGRRRTLRRRPRRRLPVSPRLVRLGASGSLLMRASLFFSEAAAAAATDAAGAVTAATETAVRGTADATTEDLPKVRRGRRVSPFLFRPHFVSLFFPRRLRQRQLLRKGPPSLARPPFSTYCNKTRLILGRLPFSFALHSPACLSASFPPSCMHLPETPRKGLAWPGPARPPTPDVCLVCLPTLLRSLLSPFLRAAGGRGFSTRPDPDCRREEPVESVPEGGGGPASGLLPNAWQRLFLFLFPKMPRS